MMRSVGFKVLKGEKLCGEVGVVGIKNDPNSSDLGKIYCIYTSFFLVEKLEHGREVQ